MIYTVYTSLYHLFKWWFGGWFIGLPTVTCLKRASKISAAQQGDRAWAKRSCQRILQGNTGTSDHRVMGVSCLRWVCVSVSISICLSFYLSICLPLSCLSIHPSRYLYINTVCIYIYTHIIYSTCLHVIVWLDVYGYLSMSAEALKNIPVTYPAVPFDCSKQSPFQVHQEVPTPLATTLTPLTTGVFSMSWGPITLPASKMSRVRGIWKLFALNKSKELQSWLRHIAKFTPTFPVERKNVNPGHVVIGTIVQ